MLINLINTARDLFFNNKNTELEAANVQDAIVEINKNIAGMHGFYPTKLPFDSYSIGDGASLEMVVNTGRVYLLTIYNSYNAGGAYVVQAGTNRGPVKVTQIAGDTSNFTVTPVSISSFSVSARNATGEICIMCIGGGKN